MELIDVLMQCYAGPRREVLSTQHACGFLASATKASGASYRAIAGQEFTVSVDASLDGVRSETAIV